jgi:tetratricopeptide (TPR) repeat protein
MNTPEIKEHEEYKPFGSPEEAPKKRASVKNIVIGRLVGLVIGLVILQLIHLYQTGYFDFEKKANKEAALEAYRRGIDAELKKDYDLAIAEYTEAIRLAPDDNDNYYFNRAQLYRHHTREYDKAIADYKESIRLHDNYVSCYIIGDIYFKLGDYENAISYYEQSLQLKPNDSDVEKRLEIAKRQISEPRSHESVQSVVKWNVGPLRDAYDKRLQDKPDLSGKITVKVAIDEFGKVVSAQVINSTMSDKEFENIVASKVKEWNFGKIDKPGDTTRVSFPLSFKY